MNLTNPLNNLKKKTNRAYATAHFALELGNDDKIGLVRSIEGGGVKAEVMSSQFGGNTERLRQTGKPKFDDIKVNVGMSMSEPFYSWIAEFFSGGSSRRDGAISAADADYRERARREFTGALIKEVTFPALAGSDKNPAQMAVSLAVEDITFAAGDGEKLTIGPGTDKQRRWTACNFFFSLDGFDEACRRCTKVESFTIKQTIIEHHTGGTRTALKLGSRIEFPNLVFTIPEADAGKLYDLAKQTLVDGAVKPLTGHLDYMDHSGKKTLATLTYGGATLVSITADKADASSGDIKQVKVELAVESMKFEYKPVVAAKPGKF